MVQGFGLCRPIFAPKTFHSGLKSFAKLHRHRPQTKRLFTAATRFGRAIARKKTGFGQYFDQSPPDTQMMVPL